MADSPQMPAEGLASYLLDVLFKQWSDDRKKVVEPKWNRNRAAFLSQPSLDPKGTWKRSDKKYPWQSDTFYPATKQKVVMGHAIVSDMLLKNGRLNFMLQPDDTAEAAAAGRSPEDTAAVESEVQVGEERIHRQLDHCDAATHVSSSILSGTIYGEFVLKRYVDSLSDEKLVEVAPGLYEQKSETEDTLAIENKTVWCIFRDLDSDSLYEGGGIIEADTISPYELRQKIGRPHYLREGILSCLSEHTTKGTPATPDPGQDGNTANPTKKDLTNRTRSIDRYECWVCVPRTKVVAFLEDMAAKGVEGLPELPAAVDGVADENSDMVEIMAVVCGRHIVRFALSTAAARPYYRGVWEASDGDCHGISVADNVENEQHVLNGAVRAMEDNAKLLSNLIIAVKREMIKGDLKTTEPGMIIDLDEDCDDAKKAIQQVQFQSILGPIQEVITMFLGFADLSSMIPRAEQGQQDPSPQTAFELRERLSRAGKYLGRVIMNYDEVIEDIIRDFYLYNTLNPALRTGKGNFRVKALGFSSFENKVIRLNTLIQMLQMILKDQTLLAISRVRYIYEEILKAMDIDPSSVIKTNEEMMADAELQAQSLSDEAGQPQDDPVDLEERRAKVQRLLAEAREKEASAKLKETDARLRQEKMVIERAKTVQAMTSPGAAGSPAMSSRGDEAAIPALTTTGA